MKPYLSRLRTTSARILAGAICVFSLVLQAPRAQQTGVSISDAPHPLGTQKQRGTEQWLCARVVDGMTGEAIANAELLLIAESQNPIRGEFSWSMRSVADPRGFLRMRVDELAPDYQPWSWVLVRAEGYVPRMSSGAFDDAIVRLSPAFTVPIEVLDWRDLPAVDALVGVCGGCGHTPDLIHARTGRDGIAHLRGFDGVSGIEDIYLEHPNLAARSDVRYWVPGMSPMRIRPQRGVTARGVLVDEQGQGIAGAYVGEKQFHRGPWTRTGAGGAFQLHGASRAGSIWVHAKGREVLFHRPLTQPYRLQMPKAPDDLHEKPQGYVEIVSLPGAQRAKPDQEPKVTSHHSTTIRVLDLPEEGSVTLRTRHDSRDVSDAVREGTAVDLPNEAFAIAIEDDAWHLRVFRYEAADAARLHQGILRLRFFEPTRIEGRVVDRDGQPVKARLAVVDAFYRVRANQDPGWSDTDGAVSMTTSHEGLRMLLVAEQSHHRRTRMVPIMLPRRGDDQMIDVGTIVLSKQPQLQILQARGEPLEEGTVTLLRAGWHDTARGAKYDIAADGSCTMPDLAAGDALLIRPPPGAAASDSTPRVVDLPTRVVLLGNGPWQVHKHAGELLVNVQTSGQAKQVALTIDDRLLPLRGPTVLRGLAPGKHQVFATAHGHRTAITSITVPETGVGHLKIELPKLPN